MKYVLFFLLQRANNLFYCSHPYNCNIFMQDLQVGGTSAVHHSGLLLHQDNKRVAFCVVYNTKV